MGTTAAAPVRIGLLLAAVLGIGGCSDGGASASDSTRPTSAAPSAGDTLFTDPFDDDANGWALPETENSRTEVLGGDFVWEAKRAAPDLRPHVLAAPLADAFDRGDGPQLRNVIVRASVTPERGTGAMGMFCREVRDTDTDFQWYEFVARDGFAAIRRGDSAGHLDVLASTHDLDLPLGREATLEAACVDDASGRARLWLSVDGTAVLVARDPDPLGNGPAGLQAYDSPDKASKARYLIRWHDFSIYRPAP
jgi:hypothetical protein